MLRSEALKRACYLVRFLLADHAPVRQHGVPSVWTDSPSLARGRRPSPSRNMRPMGQPAVPPGAPLFGFPSAPRQALTCCAIKATSHTPESIALHEMAHMLHRLGAEFAIDGWNDRLKASYTSAKANGLWSNTYAQKDYIEYFAEGVQSYFDDNWRVEKADGHHNNISTRKQLMNYDPQLHGVIDELFPCKNTLLARCSSTREEEQNQILKMDCVPYVASPTDPACKDTTVKCMAWASTGECQKNPGWMNNSCALSCKQCTPNNG
ncbi:hypothetical protein BaRGS_00040409 [Batillaria attramentaria]|uniref:ShKT domain-containing protein n=1 Tax=Batillaria attramentaria TaxID=370345 RepID=A0ABD0J0R8_9CAEN